MFDSISNDYDRLNHILSLDIDKIWRKRAVKHIISKNKEQRILDIACGTGDFSIEIASRAASGSFVQGIDLSDGMLSIMREKIKHFAMEDRIGVQKGNCEQLPYLPDSFDAASIGFGIRNFEHRELALREILRVLKSGGRLVILELSTPSCPVIGALYKIYFTKILPLIGGKISGEKSAYRYLPASVLAFPKKKVWMETMRNCGFRDVTHRAFSFGLCRMYIGYK